MRIPRIVKFDAKGVKRKVRNRRFDIVTVILVTIAVGLSVIATCYTAYKMNEIRNGKDVGDLYNYIQKENDIFNIKNYSADIEATIVSNKNVNTYNIKQSYMNINDIVKSKTEFKDATGNIITAIFNGSDMQLKSNNQKLVYMLEDYTLNNLNYLDLDAIINKYMKIKNGEIKGSIKNLEKDNELKMVIEYDKEDGWYNNKISSSEIVIDNNNKRILNLVHYDNNKKIVCNIKYNELKINKGIDQGIFNF